nr:hypothetical protein [uncultured Desulfobacter sp.]
MQLYFITEHFKARRLTYDEKQNVLWLDPNFKERFLKGRQVGFNLDLLRSIKEYPALCSKVAVDIPLAYFTLHLKDLKVALGVDEAGLAFVNTLKIPDLPSIAGNPIVQKPLT